MSEQKEIPLDIKNDIKLAFDLYKNENNKINKLKLRTLLFSFIMYKSSPSDINEYIDSKLSNEKELYSFDDVCDLINEKLDESKEKDADELYDYIANNKNNNGKINKNQIKNAFESCDINLDEKEIDKMIYYIKNRKIKGEEAKGENGDNEELKKQKSGKKNIGITRDEFREFYVEQK